MKSHRSAGEAHLSEESNSRFNAQPIVVEQRRDHCGCQGNASDDPVGAASKDREDASQLCQEKINDTSDVRVRSSIIL